MGKIVNHHSKTRLKGLCVLVFLLLTCSSLQQSHRYYIFVKNQLEWWTIFLESMFALPLLNSAWTVPVCWPHCVSLCCDQSLGNSSGCWVGCGGDWCCGCCRGCGLGSDSSSSNQIYWITVYPVCEIFLYDSQPEKNIYVYRSYAEK